MPSALDWECTLVLATWVSATILQNVLDFLELIWISAPSTSTKYWSLHHLPGEAGPSLLTWFGPFDHMRLARIISVYRRVVKRLNGLEPYHITNDVSLLSDPKSKTGIETCDFSGVYSNGLICLCPHWAAPNHSVAWQANILYHELLHGGVKGGGLGDGINSFDQLNGLIANKNWDSILGDIFSYQWFARSMSDAAIIEKLKYPGIRSGQGSR